MPKHFSNDAKKTEDHEDRLFSAPSHNAAEHDARVFALPEEPAENEPQAAPTPHSDASSSRSAAPAPRKPRRRPALWAAAILACVVALVTGTYLTFTAFNANDFLKAVVVTGTSQNLFASDMLSGYTIDPEENIVVRPVVVDTSGDKCSFTFRIYNCLLEDPNKFNDKEITYDLSITAEGADGGTWSISEKGSHTFPTTRGEIKTYTVTLDRALVDKATFTVKATVQKENSPGTSLYCLAAKIAPAQRADVQVASVQGDWINKTDSVDNYHAYNYRVTVTGKDTKVTLHWGEKVELDRFFATNHAGATVNYDNHTATFTMKPGSEIINFYRTGDAPTSWDDIGVTVSGDN